MTMTSLDAPDHPLIEALRAAFDALIEIGRVDIARPGAGNEVEIQADEWTLHFEGWPLVVAWIALDEEPTGTNARIAAVDAALGAREIAAMREVNARLDGGLAAALQASGDELSVVLAAAIVESGSDGDQPAVPDHVDG